MELLTLAHVAARLQTGKDTARSILVSLGVQAFDLGRGRGRGLRWDWSEIEAALAARRDAALGRAARARRDHKAINDAFAFFKLPPPLSS